MIRRMFLTPEQSPFEKIVPGQIRTQEIWRPSGIPYHQAKHARLESLEFIMSQGTTSAMSLMFPVDEVVYGEKSVTNCNTLAIAKVINILK